MLTCHRPKLPISYEAKEQLYMIQGSALQETMQIIWTPMDRMLWGNYRSSIMRATEMSQ